MLINHRISWLSGFQALLFGGLALCWGDPGKSVLVGLFCVLGFCLATLSYLSLAASTAAKGKLMVLWDKLGESGTDDIGISATPYDSWSWKRYFAAWNLVPLLFAITWIFVLAVNLIQPAGPTGGGIPAIPVEAKLIRAGDQDSRDAFGDEIRQAIESVSSPELTALFDWEDVDEERRDEVDLLWGLNFAYDLEGDGRVIEAVQWVGRDDFGTAGLEAISRIRILGKFVVTGETLRDGGKTSAFSYDLYAGKNAAGEWKLIVTNQDSRIDFGDAGEAETENP